MDRKPNEIIQDFLDLMERANGEYENAQKLVNAYDMTYKKRLNDLNQNCDIEYKENLFTLLCKETLDAQEAKEQLTIWEDICEFKELPTTDIFLNRLRDLLDVQAKKEEPCNADCC